MHPDCLDMSNRHWIPPRTGATGQPLRLPILRPGEAAKATRRRLREARKARRR